MKYKESEIIEEGLSPNINVELHTAQMRHDAQLLIDKRFGDENKGYQRP